MAPKFSALPNTLYHKCVLDWYDQHQRSLPWRARPGAVQNPYYVWLSEIMLQQTTVPTVIAYFQNFQQKWPRVQDLADASLDEVLHAWQGLGYYARARNLHKCAGIIVEQYQGNFPTTYDELLQLPGIGPYTAAAIMSIAFDQSTPVMDGNIERIMARLFVIKKPLREAKPQLYQKAALMTPKKRSGDYAQALMDIASSICTPKNPACTNCPIQSFCKAATQEKPDAYPVPSPKIKKPTRYGTIYWLENEQGAVLIQKRPIKGLLAGLMEIPSSDWIASDAPLPVTLTSAPVPVEWLEAPLTVRHTFTHFHLHLKIVCGRVKEEKYHQRKKIWCAKNEIKNHAFPTLMKKVINSIW